MRRGCALLGVALYYHAEPYREPEGRRAVLLLASLGAAVLWAVPTAAGTGVPDPELYGSVLGPVIAGLWTGSHLVAAAAAGLLVGHVAGVPRWANVLRAQVGLGLAATAWLSSPHGLSGFFAAGLLLGAVWLGDTSRRVESNRSDGPARAK